MRFRWSFLTPIPGICAGAIVTWANGIAPTAFATNVAGALVGLFAACWLTARSRDALAARAPLLGCIALAATALTLANPGLSGVHRWLVLGPIRLNASSVASPLILSAIAALLLQHRCARALALTVAAQTIHAVEPDRGQALAFALGAAVLFGFTAKTPARWRVAGCLAAGAGAGAAAFVREDPLPPVPEVEQILHLASAVGPGALLFALLSIGALFAPIALGLRRVREGASEWAATIGGLGAYVVSTFAMTELGSFPVPVIGAGAGPVIGVYIVLGLVEALSSEASTAGGIRRGEPVSPA